MTVLLSLTACEFGPFTSQSADVPDPVPVTPNDPLYGFDASTQWYLSAINAPGAWGLYEANAGVSYAGEDIRPVTVSVIDGGIVAGHEDLSSVLSTDGLYFIRGNAIRIPEGLPLSSAGDPHGTHVSGLIAAPGANGRGIAGATYNGWPGPMFFLTPVIALDKNGDGYVSDVAVGILYSSGIENDSGVIASRRAGVINMSLGARSFEDYSDVLLFRNAVEAASSADVLIVAASGNGIDPDGDGPKAPIGQNNGVNYPARFSSVIAVGSVDQDLGRSVFSDYGPNLELVAPGARTSGTNSSDISGILSTYYPNPYAYLAGTSMATPLVAAAAALVRSANPYLSAADVRRILQETAVDLGTPGWDAQFGYGLVDMEAALRRALTEPYGRFSPSRSFALSTTPVVPSRISDERRAEYDAARAEATWDPAGPRRAAVLVAAGGNPDAIVGIDGVRRFYQSPVPDGYLLRLELDDGTDGTTLFETLRSHPDVLLITQERPVHFSGGTDLQTRSP